MDCSYHKSCLYQLARNLELIIISIIYFFKTIQYWNLSQFDNWSFVIISDKMDDINRFISKDLC